MLSLGSSLACRIRRVRWALAGGLILLTLRAQPPEIAGTLPEDLFPVLKPILLEAIKSPRLMERNLEIALNEARLIMVDSQRWPRVGGDASYASNQAAVAGENRSERFRDNGLFYALEVNQPLFHWGALRNDTLRARISVAIAEKNFGEAYRLVLLTLRQSYLDLVTLKSGLVQQRHRQKLREAALESDQEKLVSGLVSPGYVEGQKLTVREHALELERAEVRFLNARRLFARAAGIPELPESEVAGEMPRPAHVPEVSTAVLAAMLRDGGKNTFEAQMYELQVNEAELAYKIARVRQLPKLNVSAGHYLENTTNANELSVTQQGVERQTVRLNAQWAIFDGFATRGAKREALAAKRLYESRMENAAADALERAQGLERLLKVEAAAMEMAETRRAIAIESRRRQSEEVELGNLAATVTEEATSQVLLSEANLAQARAAYLRIWSEFVSVAGADPLLTPFLARHARELR